MFIPERTIYNLHFEDPSLSELEIQVYACSVAQFNEIMSGATAVGDEAVKGANKLLQLFADHVVKWNIGDPATGKELPKSAEALGSLEQPLVIRIIAAWQAAMVTVPNPSRARSYSGAPSEELSLGLANGSQSQPSWPQ